MTPYKIEITAEMNLKKIIAESKEVAQALNEFADNLERIEKKYTEPQEISDHNLKMWHDIYEEEKRRTEGSDKEFHEKRKEIRK